VKTHSYGVLAGMVAAVALAAPALGAPANVTVRVEGTNATLVPETAVLTTTTPVERDGHSCPGTSALGAIDAATGGDWSGTWFDGLGWSVDAVRGESYAYPNYLDFWINATYASTGLCGTELQAGDDVVLVPAPDGPLLDLTGVPATATVGQPVAVDVQEHGVTLNPDFSTTPFDGPAVGATVTYGGATATVGADGKAQLTFTTAGRQTVQATQAGHVRSVVRAVEVAAAPAPGAQPPPPPPTAQDTTAPVAAFASGLADGKVFARRKAPRELSGTVSADPSGLRSVRLSIRRQKGAKCWTFRDTTERFKRHACGGKWYFRIGDRAEWSYLLPRKLPKGRYTIGVMAVDRVFNESRTEIEVRVR
jgi:hypothetical protein